MLLFFLGIVLLLGPASRIFSFPDPYLKYRKETGIISFFLLFFHIIFSLFFLPEKFPLSSFFNGLNLAFIFGLLASFVLTLLFFISNEKAMNYFGRQKWWEMQYRGVRIAFFLYFFMWFLENQANGFLGIVWIILIIILCAPFCQILDFWFGGLWFLSFL